MNLIIFSFSFFFYSKFRKTQDWKSHMIQSQCFANNIYMFFFDRVNSNMSICFDWDLNNLCVNASFSNLELFKSLSSLTFNSTEAYLASLWLNSLKKSCTTLMYIFIFFLESFVKIMLQFNSYFLYTYIEHFLKPLEL